MGGMELNNAPDLPVHLWNDYQPARDMPPMDIVRNSLDGTPPVDVLPAPIVAADTRRGVPDKGTSEIVAEDQSGEPAPGSSATRVASEQPGQADNSNELQAF